MAMAGRRPLYADNQNNVKFDTNDEDFSGWMLKESRWLKDWRRRFFILKGSRLFFAKSETGECHGLIDLTEVITVRPAEFKTEKRNTLEIATQVSNTYFDEDDIDEIESMDGNSSKFPSIKESDESELIC